MKRIIVCIIALLVLTTPTFAAELIPTYGCPDGTQFDKSSKMCILPAWVIDIAKEPGLFKPYKVSFYETVDGRSFYLFHPFGKDVPYPLYDINGKYVCAPWGGWTGGGDGKCTKLAKELMKVKPSIIWEDVKH